MEAGRPNGAADREELGKQLMTQQVLPGCHELKSTRKRESLRRFGVLGRPQIERGVPCHELHLPGTFTRGGLWMVLCPSFLPGDCWVQLLSRLGVLPSWQAHTACHGLQTCLRKQEPTLLVWPGGGEDLRLWVGEGKAVCEGEVEEPVGTASMQHCT